MSETPPRLVVSAHDVSPATAEETARWCADADALGVPVSLLVIPGPWRGASLLGDPDYAEVLRSRVARGDALVLHGWRHQASLGAPSLRRAAGRILARGAAEFAALDEDEAAVRLDLAQSVLAELGLTATGFTPPGWLASPGTEWALRRAGFRYTTSHTGVRDLENGRVYRGFALSHRPTGGAGQWLGSVLIRALSRRLARNGGLVRVALHPEDLHRRGLREITVRAIEAALSAGARPITYDTLVRGPRAAPADITVSEDPCGTSFG